MLKKFFILFVKCLTKWSSSRKKELPVTLADLASVFNLIKHNIPTIEIVIF